jgi:hypothetical protein
MHAGRFYTRVLGMRRLPRPPFPFGGAWLQGGGLTLHLIDDDPTIPRKAEHDWKARACGTVLQQCCMHVLNDDTVATQDQYEVDRPEPWYIRRGAHKGEACLHAWSLGIKPAWADAELWHRSIRCSQPGGGRAALETLQHRVSQVHGAW